MKSVRLAVVLSSWATLAPAPSVARADLAVTNVTPSFPNGPFTCLYVDPADRERIAIGTASGHVAWTENAGEVVSESRALSPRRYDPIILRGTGPRSELARPSSNAARATRLFIAALNSGARFARWSFWMSITDPYTDISSVTMPSETGSGRMLIATSTGVMLSDHGRSAWTRVLGAPGTMPRERDLNALSVTVDPSDPNHVIAGTTQGVMVSNNAGFTFSPHSDPRMQDEYVFGFEWSPAEPGMVLAIAGSAVLQSADRGASFQVAYSSTADVYGVALGNPSTYVATSDGLVMMDANGGETKLLRGRTVVGTVAFGAYAVAATDEELVLVLPQGELVPLARTTASEPFLALRGGEDIAWAITPRTVFKIGEQVARAPSARSAPRLRLSLSEVEDAVREAQQFGGPTDSRMHSRWYAKLLPRVFVDVAASRGQSDGVVFDGTFPVRFRRANGGNESDVDYSVMALWNLSEFMFGDENVSNPNLFLERNLRDERTRILGEVRTRYREASNLVHELENPPVSNALEVAMRLRLEEHAAYLEALAQREVVEGETL